MKRTYMKPTVKVFKMQSQMILAGSDYSINNTTVSDYEDLE